MGAQLRAAKLELLPWSTTAHREVIYDCGGMLDVWGLERDMLTNMLSSVMHAKQMRDEVTRKGQVYLFRFFALLCMHILDDVLTLLFQPAVCHRSFPALPGPGAQGTR